MDIGSADRVFRCLGDSHRRLVLRLLAEGPLSGGELVSVLQLPQSTVSRHLKALREAGLVSEMRQGARVIMGLVEQPGESGENGPAPLVLDWLRGQDLPPAIRLRLDTVLEGGPPGDAFQRLAYHWDELRRHWFGSRFHLHALNALLPTSWKVADIGTGTGYLLPTLSRRFSSVEAIDPSPAMLDLARQRAKRLGLRNVSFKPGRLEQLPLSSGSIDVALALLVLHHASDLRQAIQELARVIRPGGQVLVVDIYPHASHEFQQLMGDPRPGLDPRELQRMLKQSGLIGISVEPAAQLDAPADDDPAPAAEAPGLYVARGQKPDEAGRGTPQ